MFRTQQNAFDEAVAKATDENLTSENWEYILVCFDPTPHPRYPRADLGQDVCDRVSGQESG
ncbi:MAG: hypothetical protein Q9182_001958 [Xanthomendoza sp. 2 TL-2023]